MKITDIEKSKLPLRVKINDKFTLEESFDPGTIIQINSFLNESDFKDCYKVNITALQSDIDHNVSIAKNEWHNSKTGKFDLTYFDAHVPDNHGNYKDTIYVMADDDCFDLILEEPDIKSELEDLISDIMLMDTNFFDDPNGAYEYSCPFCDNYISVKGGEKHNGMLDIEHSDDCLYIKAKNIHSKYFK
jgi:hypothetical protein